MAQVDCMPATAVASGAICEATLIFDAVPRAGVYPSPQLGWEQLIPSDAAVCPLPHAEFNVWSDANTRCIAETLKRNAGH